MENDFKSNKIKLIIGLGNPDDKYEDTYHNVGIQFVRLLRNKITPPHTKKIYESQCFMNLSGLCVQQEVSKYDISHNELLIVQDDSDIPVGEYKFSFGRGSAGHKGIESIVNHLETKDFWRLRIGIGREDERVKASSFVLRKISNNDQESLQNVFEDLLTIISK